ncbi:MAG: hypothetical protein P8009_09785 [Gammaproteobacteria bacterium]
MNLAIHETLVLQAADILYWVDAASGTSDSVEAKRPIGHTLSLRVDTGPADLVVRHRPGSTAVWRRRDRTLVEGVASEAERARPSGLSFPLSATVFDPKGRYNPRRIALSAGTDQPHILVLYPSARATTFGPGGGLQGRLCFDADNRSVSWARLSLTVDTGPHSELVFWAQADGDGEFRLSTHRLPPLPEGQQHYSATLRVDANPAADAHTPLDLSVEAQFQTMAISKQDHHPPAQQFTDALSLHVKPANVQRLASDGKDCLALKPS